MENEKTITMALTKGEVENVLAGRAKYTKSKVVLGVVGLVLSLSLATTLGNVFDLSAWITIPIFCSGLLLGIPFFKEWMGVWKDASREASLMMHAEGKGVIVAKEND